MKTKPHPTIKPLTIDPTFDWSRCKCGARFQTTAELDKHFHAEHR